VDWASLLPGLIESLPELGIGGIVLSLLVIREASAKNEREHYRTERTDWDSRMKAARAEWETERGKLREENDSLETRLDSERERRRDAEDGNARTLRLPPVTPREITS
jgi:hypothetical protein